jgi:hypothetical protein
MGNSCVASGANPNSMGYYLINKSSKRLTLSEVQCNRSCQGHFGFSVHSGKFKEGWEPTKVIEAGGDSKCWMSGRELATPKPAGWIIYNIEGGGTLNIEFDYDNWMDLQNQFFLMATIFRCATLKVTVRQKNIETVISNGFEGSDVKRQFEILISDEKNNTIS